MGFLLCLISVAIDTVVEQLHKPAFSEGYLHNKERSYARRVRFIKIQMKIHSENSACLERKE